MTTIITTLFILFIVCILTFFWVMSLYKAWAVLIDRVNLNKQQIDTQLDRRFEVFQSLIEAVKHSMDYERSTLKEVVALRRQAEEARFSGHEQSRIYAENEISKIASRLNRVFEQYPELKAGKNVMQLQEEIINTENKLAYAKQALNDSIAHYNAKKKSFLEPIIMHVFANQLDKTYMYWQQPENPIRTE